MCDVRRGSRTAQLLRSLSPLHSNCLIFVVAFMKEALRYSAHNLLTDAVAARVLGSMLFRKGPSDDAFVTGDDTPLPTPAEQDALDAIGLHLLQLQGTVQG